MFLAILKTDVNDYEIGDTFDIIAAGHDYPTVRNDAMDVFTQKVFYETPNNITPFAFSKIAAINGSEYKRYDVIFINLHNTTQIPLNEKSISLMYSSYQRDDIYKKDSRISVISKDFVKEAFEKVFIKFYEEKGLTPNLSDMSGLFESLWKDPDNGYETFYS